MANSSRTKPEMDVDQLWSLQEIRNLAYKYAYAVDTIDQPLMESLWVNTPEPAPYPKLDVHVIRNQLETLIGKGSSMLLVGNHLITMDSSDRAHGIVYCLAFVDWGIFFDQSIIYHDLYERHDDQWFFRTRDHVLMWGDERKPNPMRQPIANWPDSQVGSGNAFETIRNGMPVTDPALNRINPYRPKPTEYVFGVKSK